MIRDTRIQLYRLGRQLEAGAREGCIIRADLLGFFTMAKYVFRRLLHVQFSTIRNHPLFGSTMLFAKMDYPISRLT